MAEYVETIKRESSQTTERREIENLRQVYGDKWYKEQLQVPINYSQPIKQEQKNHYHKELIMELRGSDWDVILEGLESVCGCNAIRAHEIYDSLTSLSKKNLLGDVCRCRLAIKLSYE